MDSLVFCPWLTYSTALGKLYQAYSQSGRVGGRGEASLIQVGKLYDICMCVCNYVCIYIYIIVNAARCPPRPSRARSVCGSTASSRAGQVAIQAWTGSGVVGPIDVMGPQESPRQGQGDAQDFSEKRRFRKRDLSALGPLGPRRINYTHQL